MSQNDLVIANQNFPNTRADINSALQALGSTNSGATAPATIYANQLWYDTTANILKMRSEANDAWISLGTLNQSLNTFTPFGVIGTSADADFTVDPTLLATRATIKTFVDSIPSGGIGDGQTWQDLIGSRSAGTTYQNTSGKPIMVAVTAQVTSARYMQVSSDNVTFFRVGYFVQSGSVTSTACFIVPNNHYYQTSSASSITVNFWLELR